MTHDDAPDERAEGARRPAPVPGPPGTPSPAQSRPGGPTGVGTAPAVEPVDGPQMDLTVDADAPIDVPVTGDAAIDGVVAELARARGGPLEGHIAAGERAHRVLQARLSDLGGE